MIDEADVFHQKPEPEHKDKKQVDDLSVLTLSKDDLDETNRSSGGMDILHEILQEARAIHGGNGSNGLDDGQGGFKTQSKQSDDKLDPVNL